MSRGQRSRGSSSKFMGVKETRSKMQFQVSFDRLTGDVEVKVKGHVGQGTDNSHDISRWAHINVKLHFLKFELAISLEYVCLQHQKRDKKLFSGIISPIDWREV